MRPEDGGARGVALHYCCSCALLCCTTGMPKPPCRNELPAPPRAPILHFVAAMKAPFTVMSLQHNSSVIPHAQM